MSFLRLFAICGLALFAALPNKPSFAAEARYTVGFVNGERAQGAEIFDWHDAKSQPRLDLQKLFDPANPVRWVQDNSLPPADMPTEFVEFIGGDRLPGRVTEYRSGTESPYQRLPPHLLVDPDVKADWPDAPRAEGIPVRTRWLRRVVWERRGQTAFRPGTLFYRDGRQVEFRAVRWGDGEVRLLLEQETRSVPFGQIAELHLPRVDEWNAWYEQLAVLSPASNATIMQMETSDGVRATASSERFYPMSRGGGDPRQWYHAVQPAWSLEPLWLPHRAIRVRRYFATHEFPLTALDPTRVLQRSALGGGWTWRVDRNVKGGTLAGGEQIFGWGFGVQSYSELEFELPPFAKSFRTQLGLDRSVGSGGCVRAMVFAGAVSGKPLFRSPPIVGTNEKLETGDLKLVGPAEESRRLTLVVDPAHADRPPGADPLEIRDTFNWFEPLVELDAVPLQREIQNRADRLIPSWQEWTLEDEAHHPAALGSVWDPANPQSRLFRLEAAPRDKSLTLSRQFNIGTEDRFLMLAVSRFEKDSTPSRLQVRFDGQSVAEFDVPARQSVVAPNPLLVSVETYRGRAIRVELEQRGDGPQALVEWSGMALVEHDPLVFPLFDDEPKFVSELNGGDAIALLESSDKNRGTSSIRITPGDKLNANMPGWDFAIRENPALGEYRFIRFAWKKSGGRNIGLHFARDGVFADASTTDTESLRYQVNRSGLRDYGASILIPGNPQKSWEVVTRDLFADFGEFNLSGLRLICPDGDAALFDGIFLARRQQDFDRADPHPK